MTIMSSNSSEQFSAIARSVFPVDVFFDPEDYVEAYNVVSRVPLSVSTFKKYVSKVCDSEYFPELSRARNNSTSPYQYFVGKGDSRGVPPVDKLSKKSKHNGVSCSLSEGALRAFLGRVLPLMGRGFHRVEPLRLRYNEEAKSKLRAHTFSHYLSLVYRLDLHPGFKRRKGFGGRYEYGHTFVSLDVVEHVPVVGHGCVSCGNSSPVVAKFCMHCGGELEVVFKAVVQEAVLRVSSGPGEDRVQEVLNRVRENIRVVRMEPVAGEGEVFSVQIF